AAPGRIDRPCIGLTRSAEEVAAEIDLRRLPKRQAPLRCRGAAGRNGHGLTGGVVSEHGVIGEAPLRPGDGRWEVDEVAAVLRVGAPGERNPFERAALCRPDV